MKIRHLVLALAMLATPVFAAPGISLSRFGDGDGPSAADGVHHLLDAARSFGQSNAIAFDRAEPGAFETTTLRCRLRVLEGGDGGAFVFLNTEEYGRRGPAPFVKSWVEPNLAGTFAVGIDVHDPKSEEPFGPWGNVAGLPEREVSLHWDGREIVKRVAPAEFRGDWAACEILLQHVIGGAEVTVKLAGAAVYERFFLPGLSPYESRLAIGAGTRAGASTAFDVKELRFERRAPARPRRPPVHVQLFNHVLTDNSKTAFETDVDLPPLAFEFGRVTMTIEIHDAGPDWDEWDRNGEVSLIDADGTRHGLVPFITSYRTECHWVVDVTHFRPWLAGKRRFEVRAGTTFYRNRGYMMSVHLDFWHGRPELEPFRIVALWNGTAHHGTADNHFRDFFEPREVEIDASARAARLFLTATGHSQVGEFTPSRRTLVFGPDKDAGASAEQRFESRLWKTDCYLNPNRPQFGTWKYPRAGWAPGDVVRPWVLDLKPHLQPGKTALLRYEPGPYEFDEGRERPAQTEIAKASQVVRSYLVLYREPTATLPAPTLRITGVEKKSGAARAGLQAGDYLASYDGRRLDSLDDLRAAIGAASKAGKKSIAVVAYRGSQRLELKLAPGRMGVSLTGPR